MSLHTCILSCICHWFLNGDIFLRYVEACISVMKFCCGKSELLPRFCFTLTLLEIWTLAVLTHSQCWLLMLITPSSSSLPSPAAGHYGARTIGVARNKHCLRSSQNLREYSLFQVLNERKRNILEKWTGMIKIVKRKILREVSWPNVFCDEEQIKEFEDRIHVRMIFTYPI